MSKKQAVYNSSTITVKLDSATSFNEWANKVEFDERKTDLKANSLQALLVSVNPLRNEYKFDETDIEKILALREEFDLLLSKVSNIIEPKRERKFEKMRGC